MVYKDIEMQCIIATKKHSFSKQQCTKSLSRKSNSKDERERERERERETTAQEFPDWMIKFSAF